MALRTRHYPSEIPFPVLAAVFDGLAEAEITYSLLRGYDALAGGFVDGDVDLLVAPDEFEALRRLLEPLGFTLLDRWGYEPHHFFVVYDKPSAQWIKLDVVTDITYGRPIPALKTTLREPCLRNRQLRGSVFVLAPEEECLTLLLHCLLDKGVFEPHYRSRLAALARETTGSSDVEAQVAMLFPSSTSWAQIRQAILDGEWDALLAAGSAVEHHLVSRDPVQARWRRISARVLRALDRRTRAIRSRKVGASGLIWLCCVAVLGGSIGFHD